MRSSTVTFAPAQLEARIRERLQAGQASRVVVWRRDDQSALIRTDQVRVRLLDGWLVVALVLQTDQTGRVPLELVYHLGSARSATAGRAAAVAANAGSREATMLAEIWGADLQRVVWDAVLDALEVALARAPRDRGESPTLRGFSVGPEGLAVDVVTGVA